MGVATFNNPVASGNLDTNPSSSSVHHRFRPIGTPITALTIHLSELVP